MAEKSGARTRALRLARLLVGRNRLRRRSDRLEGLIVVLLAAVFVAAVAAAPWFAGRLYQSQRGGAAGLHPATAVLTQNGPSDSYVSLGEATARWRAPDGRAKKGMLTTATAPAITGAPAGARVPVWLTASGQPQLPPPSSVEVMLSSVVLAISALCGTAVALLICYWLCRLVLDRRRLVAWTSEWHVIGPRWTTRL